MTKYANDHPYKLVVGEGDGIYANDHPYKVEIEGGVVTPEEFEELEKKVDALATDLSYKGGVPTYDDLPADPEQGDVYTVEDTGVLYVWDGDEWVALNETKESIKTLTTDDYNYHKTGDTNDGFATWIAQPGIYIAGEDLSLYPSRQGKVTFKTGAMVIIASSTESVAYRSVLYSESGGDYIWSALTISTDTGGAIYGGWTGTPVLLAAGVKDNLTSTEVNRPLSAKQGKVLNERIGDLTTLTTTAKTSTVAAINEIVVTIGNVESALNIINNGSES